MNILDNRLKDCNMTRQDIINKVKPSDSEKQVFIYISQLEGLGNKESDFDVYVISKSNTSISDQERKNDALTENVVVKGKIIDFEYWDLQDILYKISSLKAKNSSISVSDLKILNRLKIGEIISGNIEGINLKELIDKNEINKIISRACLEEATACLDDTVRMYNTDEYICSLNMARIALERSISALNAKNGFANTNAKWVSKIFINNNGYYDGFMQRYYKLQVYSNVNEENIKSFVEDIIEFAQDIISKIVLQ